jgi:hypothetical protein
MAVMRLDDPYRDQLNSYGRALARCLRVTDRWHTSHEPAQA